MLLPFISRRIGIRPVDRRQPVQIVPGTTTISEDRTSQYERDTPDAGVPHDTPPSAPTSTSIPPEPQPNVGQRINTWAAAESLPATKRRYAP